MHLAEQILEPSAVWDEYLNQFRHPHERRAWELGLEAVRWNAEQLALIRSFPRRLEIRVLVGSWCKDCARQAPILASLAAIQPLIQVRFLEQEEHAELQQELQINGGQRVPVALFFSEDGFEVSRFGDRPLAVYRQMMIQSGLISASACKILSAQEELAASMAEWLQEIERVQWILRLSPRLRRLHGD